MKEQNDSKNFILQTKNYGEKELDERISKRVGKRLKHEKRVVNSLTILTKRFIELMKSNPDGLIDINNAVQLLGVEKRRIYEITNVLEGINYLQKIHKNLFKYTGGQEVSKEIVYQAKLLQDLQAQQKALDEEIKMLASQIKEEIVVLSGQTQQYSYFTQQDCKNICQKFKPQDPAKGILLISSPTGTSLTIQQQEDQHILKIVSLDNKEIQLFSCFPEVQSSNLGLDQNQQSM